MGDTQGRIPRQWISSLPHPLLGSQLSGQHPSPPDELVLLSKLPSQEGWKHQHVVLAPSSPRNRKGSWCFQRIATVLWGLLEMSPALPSNHTPDGLRQPLWEGEGTNLSLFMEMWKRKRKDSWKRRGGGNERMGQGGERHWERIGNEAWKHKVVF